MDSSRACGLGCGLGRLDVAVNVAVDKGWFSLDCDFVAVAMRGFVVDHSLRAYVCNVRQARE